MIVGDFNSHSPSWGALQGTHWHLHQVDHFLQRSVNKNASNFSSAVLKAAKESIPRGRRHDYKLYWNNTMEKIHKELSETREEMKRNPTPQNVRRLPAEGWSRQRKTDTSPGKLENKKQHPLTWRMTLKNSGSWQSFWMETTQSGAEQHCKPQMDLSQERRQQTSLPEFLKKRAQLHPQLTESKMSWPRHGLCSKTQLQLALTHVWLNAWPSESLKEHWKRLSRRRLQDLMESQMKCWNTSALEQSVPYCASTTKAGRQVLYQQTGRNLLWDPFQKREKTSGILPATARSVCSAVLENSERIINKRLMWHLESNSVLASTQTGYRLFRSTEDQLALLTQYIEDAFQERKKVLAVFFDLLKAVDKVWKEGLLLKLLRAGVHGKMYKWLSDFLFNRTARCEVRWNAQ